MKGTTCPGRPGREGGGRRGGVGAGGGRQGRAVHRGTGEALPLETWCAFVDEGRRGGDGAGGLVVALGKRVEGGLVRSSGDAQTSESDRARVGRGGGGKGGRGGFQVTSARPPTFPLPQLPSPHPAAFPNCPASRRREATRGGEGRSRWRPGGEAVCSWRKGAVPPTDTALWPPSTSAHPQPPYQWRGPSVLTDEMGP